MDIDVSQHSQDRCIPTGGKNIEIIENMPRLADILFEEAILNPV